MAIGLLLVAFPAAHSEILRALYLPATLMLIGLILRGVAFDFRAKVKVTQKRNWDLVFKIGSIMTSATQGFMLGMFVMGFEYTVASIVFAVISGFGVTTAYALILLYCSSIPSFKKVYTQILLSCITFLSCKTTYTLIQVYCSCRSRY